MTDTPDTLPAPAATAMQAILGTLVRTGLKVLGTQGVMDAVTEAGLKPALAQEFAGAAMVGTSAWSIVRACSPTPPRSC